jgi:tetraacyldisaccharide 4'-kinase
MGALRDADAIAVVDGPLAPADGVLLSRVAGGPRRFAAVRRPTGLRPLQGGAPVTPASLRGASVGLLAGLANPESLRRTLRELGAVITAERIFPDHHRYRRRDLRGLADAAPLWVTTEKDAFKIVPSWVGRADVRVLGLEVDVLDGGSFLDWLESRLR